MKRLSPPFLLSAALAGAALLLAGCNTFERRAEEKAPIYNALDPQTQSRLKKGEISVGDTQDLVYIALGNPDEKREKVTDSGATGTWIYNTYWQEYQGTVTAGYERQVVYDPRTKRYYVYYRPVRTDVYRERSEDKIRVDFKNGKVTAVEQAK